MDPHPSPVSALPGMTRAALSYQPPSEEYLSLTSCPRAWSARVQVVYVSLSEVLGSPGDQTHRPLPAMMHTTCRVMATPHRVPKRGERAPERAGGGMGGVKRLT